MPENPDQKIVDIPHIVRSRTDIVERLSLSVPTDMRYVEAIVQMLEALCKLTDPRATLPRYLEDLSTALREACSHLIEKQKNPKKQFVINFYLFNNRIEIEVEDPAKEQPLPARASTVADEGYPLHQIQTRVDRVSYRATSELGVLSLTKYFVMPACNF